MKIYKVKVKFGDTLRPCFFLLYSLNIIKLIYLYDELGQYTLQYERANLLSQDTGPDSSALFDGAYSVNKGKLILKLTNWSLRRVALRRGKVKERL